MFLSTVHNLQPILAFLLSVSRNEMKLNKLTNPTSMPQWISASLQICAKSRIETKPLSSCSL